MREHPRLLMPTFQSSFAENLNGFVAEKRASGYKYNRELRTLREIDRVLLDKTPVSHELSKDLVTCWLAKRPNERAHGHVARVSIMRQFAQYLARQGIQAYVPSCEYARYKRSSFVPHIFTLDEVRRMLTAVDQMKASSWSPRRHLILPEVFRLLYGCGLRVSEVLCLRVHSVDLDQGVLNICDAKFGKDRIVPLAPSLTERLRRFAEQMGVRDGSEYFFPAPDGGAYRYNTIYDIFRKILATIGIPHGGRGYGPRVHDLRHTYAIHRLIGWYREKADLHAKVPILATYLGHRNIISTQKYLQLVPELFPEVTQSLEDYVGHLIPQRRDDAPH